MGVLVSKAHWANWCNEMKPIKNFWVEEGLLKFQKMFEHIGISEKKVRLLLHVFRKMDRDGSGTVSVFEFFQFFNFQFVSPMARRYFTLFDDGNTGTLNFAEFAACVWNYNSLNEEAIIDFAFQIYDLDNSKALDSFEIVRMLQEAYGSNKRMDQNTTDLCKMLRKDAKSKNGQEIKLYDRLNFRAFVLRQKSTFYPLFVLWREMRFKVMGTDFWDKMTKAREKTGELERIDIENFKGEIRHVKNNEPGKYRKQAARKKVGKKKKTFKAGKSYISSAATAKKWARKKRALESGKIHPHAQSKQRT